MFRRLLVAHRGEIALRVLRTARAMGIECIAVHSDPDAGALHTRMAHVAVALEGRPPSDTYLRIDRILATAKIIHRQEIEKAGKDAAPRAAVEKEKAADHEATFSNPHRAAARGFIDDVIEPRETRGLLIRSLELLKTKREARPSRKHGNIPL